MSSVSKIRRNEDFNTWIGKLYDEAKQLNAIAEAFKTTGNREMAATLHISAKELFRIAEKTCGLWAEEINDELRERGLA